MRLALWHTDGPSAPRYVAVLAHGVDGSRDELRGRIALHRARGAAVVALDHRGHGASEPVRLSFGLHERLDVAGAAAFARRLWPDAPLLLAGRSLGGVAALGTAAVDEECAALLCEQPFESIDRALHDRLTMRLGPLAAPAAALFRLHAGWLYPSDVLTLAPYVTARDVRAPSLFLAGSHDAHAPPDGVRLISDECPTTLGVTLFEGAAHGDLLRHDPALYAGALDALLAAARL